jgi:hypothetical protein
VTIKLPNPTENSKEIYIKQNILDLQGVAASSVEPR